VRCSGRSSRSPRRMSAASRGDGRLAALDPAAEDRDPVLRPGAVTGHRPVLQLLQDGIGVLGDIVEGPQVEYELHRAPVALTEQRPDVRLEVERLILARQL